MGFITDTLFGGAEKKAAQAQANATKESMQITKEGVQEAKNALNEISPLALQMLGGSAQQGIDLLGAATQNQANLAQEGNVKAQEQIANSLPMIQAALMGQPLDFSKMQATKLQLPNMGFLNQKVSPSINIPQQQAPVANSPTQFDRVGQNSGYGNFMGVDIGKLLSGVGFGGSGQNPVSARVAYR